MRLRLRVIAMVMFALAAVLLLWPWHRTYEARRLTCGPAILALFPSDPVGQHGAERRASDQCLNFARKSAALGVVAFSVGGYALIRVNRGRYPPPRPMAPPADRMGAEPDR